MIYHAGKSVHALVDYACSPRVETAQPKLPNARSRRNVRFSSQRARGRRSVSPRRYSVAVDQSECHTFPLVLLQNTNAKLENVFS